MKVSKNVVVNLQDGAETFISTEGDGIIAIGQTNSAGTESTVTLKLEDLKTALKAFGRGTGSRKSTATKKTKTKSNGTAHSIEVPANA